MAEINTVRIAGNVTWFQNWAPQPGKESWGGTLALRVSLPPDQINFATQGEVHTVHSQELFVQVKYKADDVGTPRMNFITKVLNGTVRSICIKDGRIIRKTKKDGSNNVFLQTKLGDIQVSDNSRGIGQLNTAHLHGRIEKVSDEWIQVLTRTRNPKTGEFKEYFHTVLLASPTSTKPEVGKYALLLGRIAAEAHGGNKMVYLATTDAFVF